MPCHNQSLRIHTPLISLSKWSSAPLYRLRHLVTGPVQVPFQRVYSRVTLPTVLADVFDRRVLTFIMTLAIVGARKCSPTYATRVGRGSGRRGWWGWPIADRRGWTVGGVRILSVATLSLHGWVWIRLLWSDKVCIMLWWDNRLSMLYWAIILEVGRNTGVQ